MQITYTFDSSWNSAPAGEEAQAQAAFAYVVNLYDTIFTNNVTVDIGAVQWLPLTAIASNSAPGGLILTYSQLLNDLQAHQDSPLQQAAFANLPTTDPTGSNNFSLNPYELEALGVPNVPALYQAQYNTPMSGTIQFNSNLSWSFGPNVLPGSSQYYFIGTAEHELSEVMGRFGLVGAPYQGNPLYSPIDLFRYTKAGGFDANIGTAANNSVAYLGYDNGKVVTSAGFNNTANGNDRADWVVDSIPNDAFGFGNTGAVQPVSADDITVMNLLGWDVAAPPSVISSGFEYWLLAGQSSDGITVLSGGTLDVGAGGNASQTILAGGILMVEAGGNADHTFISAGGSETVLGTETSATVVSGGELTVSSGGIALGATVSSGGSENVSATGSDTLAVVDSGGVQIVWGGGFAFNGTIDGGEQDLRGTASRTLVENGGTEFVEAGGIASNTSVGSGGNVDVRAGGRAAQAIILGGGSETVEGFGLDGGSHVYGKQYVYGSAGFADIASGGLEQVEAAGTASDVHVESSGTIDIYGSALGVSIDSGGTAIVHDGAVLQGGYPGPGIPNQGTLEFDLTGADTFQTPLTGSGSLVLKGGGSLVLGGGDAFTGTVTVSSGTLELTSSTAAGSGPISFGSVAGGVLKIDGTVMPANTIKGLLPGDEIDLAAVAFSPTGTATVATGNKLQVVENGTTYVLQLDPTANYSKTAFVLSQDGHGGTAVSEAISSIGGNWTSPGSWSTDTVPGPADDVLINAGMTIVDTNPNDKPNSSKNPQQLANVGTVRSLTMISDLVFDYGALTTIDNLTVKWGMLVDTGSFDGGQGGSQVTVDGTLVNDDSLRIGNPGLLRPTIVTANGLFNLGGGPTGVVNLIGSATSEATLDINAAAGSGTAGALSGTFDIEGHALLEFASGQITSLATGSELLINGIHAFVADSSDTSSNTALAGLASIGAGNATLDLENGASAHLTGNLVNNSFIILDNDGDGGEHGNGGGVLTVDGVLTNKGYMFIGNTHLKAPDLVTAGGLNNFGSITITGSTITGASNAGTLAVGGATFDAGNSTIGPFGSLTTGSYQLGRTANLYLGASGGGIFQYGTVTVSGPLILQGLGIGGSGSTLHVAPTVAFAAGTKLTIMTFTPGELSGMFQSIVSGNGTFINLGNGMTAGLLYNDSLGTVQYEFVATPASTAGAWSAGVTGAWTTAADWSAGAPTFYTDATIGAGANVTLGTDATIDSLTLGNNAAVTVQSGYSLSVGAGLTLATGAVLTVNGEMTASSASFFMTDLGSVIVNGWLDIRGVPNGGGPFSGGTFTIHSGGTLEFDTKDYNNVTFAGPGATLVLDDLSEFVGTLAGFQRGGILQVGDPRYPIITGAIYNATNHDLVLSDNGSTVATIAVAAADDYSKTHFKITVNGNVTTIQALTPQVTAVNEAPATGDLGIGASDTLTLTTNEAMTVTGAPTLALNDGGTATYDRANSTSTSLAFDYKVAATDTSVPSLAATAINLPTGAGIADASGFPLGTLSLAGLAQVGPQIDTVPPTVTAVTETPASGTLDIGAKDRLTLAISEPVTVFGTPALTLNNGGMATYDKANSTSTSLVFDYTVAPTDTSVPALAVSGIDLLTGFAPARILDGVGNALDGSSISTRVQNGPKVDTDVTFSFTPPRPSDDVEGLQLLSFTKTGPHSFRISFDAAASATILEDDGAKFVLGPAKYTNDVVTATFSKAFVTSYNVSVPPGGTKPVYTVAFAYVLPTVTALTQSATGDLRIGESETLTLTTNEAVTVTGVPRVAMNDRGTATYDAAKSTPTSLVFDYTMAPTDTSVASLAATAIDLPAGASIVDAAGNSIAGLPLAGLTQTGPQTGTGAVALTYFVRFQPSPGSS